IAVTDSRTDQPADELVVAPGKEAPPPRVLSADAVADDDRLPAARGNETFQLGEIELPVRVRERDPLAPRGLEASPQRRAITAVAAVPQQAHARPFARQVCDDRGRVVATAIVDDQDFVVV